MSADSSAVYFIIGVCLLFSAAVACAATPLVMKFARKIGAMDVPTDGRRMHNHPIPLLGGLSIIIAFYITGLLAALVLGRYYDTPLLHLIEQILPGSLIVAAVSFIDDLKDLPAWPRLLVQCGAAAVTVAMGVQIRFISGSVTIFGVQFFRLGIFSVPITILWIVGITNALNWVDGLDGLAAGVTAIASVSILLIALLQDPPQYAVAILTAALAGGCLGLLPFNRNPAKIFMGDTGSMFLGFVLAVVSIQGLFKFYAAVSFAVPLLVLGLPLLDTVSTVIRRIAGKKSPLIADRSHIHHKLIDMGLSQKQAVALLYTISMVLGVVAVLFTVFGTTLGWRFMAAGLLVIAVLFYALVTIFRKRNIRIAASAAADRKNAPGGEGDCAGPEDAPDDRERENGASKPKDASYTETPDGRERKNDDQ